MKKLWLWVLGVIVIGGVVGGALWLRQKREAEAVAQEALRTATVQRGTLELTVLASGNVVAAQDCDLSFEMPGQVISVTVEVGDRVRAGQPLARLDDTSPVRAVRQAELALDEARLNLATLTKPPDADDIALAKLALQSAAQSMAAAKQSEEAAQLQGGQNVQHAQEALDDVRQMYDEVHDQIDRYHLPDAYAAGATAAYMETEGNVGVTQVKAEQQIQQAKSQWLTAYHNYKQAEQQLQQLQDGPDEDQVRQAQLQVEQAQLSLEQARLNEAKTLLTAPCDGAVTAVNIQEGLAAPNGQPAISLMNDAQFYAEVTVDETDIAAVAVGQPVSVTVDAYPNDPLPGVVDRIAILPVAGLGTVAYPVQVRLQPQGTVVLREGMTAEVTIRTERRDDVLLIPNWAIRTDQETGQVYTYVLPGGDQPPERREITVGGRNEAFTEVLGGLEEGQTVALVLESRTLPIFQGRPPRQRR